VKSIPSTPQRSPTESRKMRAIHVPLERLEPIRFYASASPVPYPGDELSICYQTRQIARLHRLFVACALHALAAQEVQAW
jgi:hypothetical protein